MKTNTRWIHWLIAVPIVVWAGACGGVEPPYAEHRVVDGIEVIVDVTPEAELTDAELQRLFENLRIRIVDATDGPRFRVELVNETVHVIHLAHFGPPAMKPVDTILGPPGTDVHGPPDLIELVPIDVVVRPGELQMNAAAAELATKIEPVEAKGFVARMLVFEGQFEGPFEILEPFGDEPAPVNEIERCQNHTDATEGFITLAPGAEMKR